MAKSKKAKKSNLDGIDIEEADPRMSNYRRAASAYEHETLWRG